MDKPSLAISPYILISIFEFKIIFNLAFLINYYKIELIRDLSVIK